MLKVDSRCHTTECAYVCTHLENWYVTFSKKAVNLMLPSLWWWWGVGGGLLWLAMVEQVPLSTWNRHLGGQSDA